MTGLRPDKAGTGTGRGIRAGRAAVGLLVVASGLAIPSAATTAVAAPLPRFQGAAWTTRIGPTHLSSPVIADVNGDGHLDVVTADLSGMLHVLDGRTGRDLPGWPQPIQSFPARRSRRSRARPSPTSTTTASKEIIVGAGSIDVPGSTRRRRSVQRERFRALAN